MRIARFLVQGVDVWLNNPRRPLEASGTSGMKAAANGVVNVSVLDGWWDEGWTGDNGWAIGGRETNPDEGAQDWSDALDLYRLLEEEVVPRYYERDRHGLPAAWVATMRPSIASTIWRFSTTRMLHEYTERMYLPAAGVPIATRARRRPSTRPADRPSPGRLRGRSRHCGCRGRGGRLLDEDQAGLGRQGERNPRRPSIWPRDWASASPAGRGPEMRRQDGRGSSK